MTLLTDLEQATEGSRDLSDRTLAEAGWESELVSRGGNPVHVWKRPGAVFGTSKRPDPTRDLQDALLLVPEGWGWSVTEMRLGLIQGRASLLNARARPSEIKGEAETPQLALCIACLRAMEAT